jgi:hypothetical protein
MFPSISLSQQEKLFKLFLYTIFISRSSTCSSSNSSNSSSNNAVIFAIAFSIINAIILQVIDYDRQIFVHLLLCCADSVIGSCSC